MVIYHVNNIPKDLADKVEGYILSSDIPWSYITSSMSPDVITDENFVSDEFIVNDHAIMSHMIYMTDFVKSKSYDEIKDLTDYLTKFFETNLIHKKLNLHRILASMTLPQKSAEGTIQQPHSDVNFASQLGITNYYSFLYYPTDSDGDTYFFETKKNYKNKLIAKSSPIKGTGVLFSSHMNHAGSLPVYSKRRIVINFAFEAV